MADWIRCTVFPSGDAIFINLDNIAVISGHDRGASITLANGVGHAVNEKPEDMMLQLAVRRHA